MAATENPWAVYDAMEVPHLERFLDEGADWDRWGIDQRDMESWARVAATRWYGPPVTVRGESGAEGMAQMYCELVIKISSHPDPGQPDFVTYNEKDGTAFVHPSWGEPIEVTEERMRHWQWGLMIFSRQDMADRYLEAIPTWAREAAMAHALSEATATNVAFIDLMVTEGIGGED